MRTNVTITDQSISDVITNMDKTQLLESSRRKEQGEPGSRGAECEKGEAGEADQEELGK